MDNVDAVAAALGVPETADLFRPHWAESAACLPEDGPPFLRTSAVRESSQWIELDPAIVERVERAADRIGADPAMRMLAWHCYRLLYTHLDYETGKIGQWPAPEAALGEEAGLFHLLLLLASVPLARDRYRELGVPENVIHDTCRDVGADTILYHDQSGRLGPPPWLLGWLRYHTTGMLYRLGRLQYMARPFRGRLVAHRHVRTHAVLALAEDGVLVDRDGLMTPGLTAETPGAWTTTLSESADAIVGCPVSPLGHIVRAQTRIEKRDWRPVLAAGDTVLEIHIPPGGGMTPERTHDSMREAIAFFSRTFPGQPFKGIACISWIFNPRFRTILAPAANLRRVAAEVHLFPVPSSGKDGLFFLFGERDVDPGAAPRDTSMRRTILKEMDAGRPLLSGGMFVLADDLDYWGTRVYRRRWPIGKL